MLGIHKADTTVHTVTRTQATRITITARAHRAQATTAHRRTRTNLRRVLALDSSNRSIWINIMRNMMVNMLLLIRMEGQLRRLVCTIWWTSMVIRGCEGLASHSTGRRFGSTRLFLDYRASILLVQQAPYAPILFLLSSAIPDAPAGYGARKQES